MQPLTYKKIRIFSGIGISFYSLLSLNVGLSHSNLAGSITLFSYLASQAIMMYPEELNRVRKHSYYILVVDQIIVQKYSFPLYLHLHGHSILP